MCRGSGDAPIRKKGGGRMTEERKARVRQIAGVLYGTVISEGGNLMLIEIPADLSGAASSMLGQGGFSGVIIGQSTRPARRRISDMQGNTVVCQEMDTTAFYTFRVELQTQQVAV